tara:strand:+ start:607 stop:711 length:105 start_codon:yes stop_codon:yes gene_type:complete
MPCFSFETEMAYYEYDFNPNSFDVEDDEINPFER